MSDPRSPSKQIRRRSNKTRDARIYLDHSATSPIDPEVLDAMLPFLHDDFGNPSSAHTYGASARRAVQNAREHVAALINASADEIVFTSGGTESNNLVIRGVFCGRACRGRRLIVSAVEHVSVLVTAQSLRESYGVDVRKISVGRDGILRIEELTDSINPETTLVSVMYVNNETGTIQPIDEVVLACKEEKVLFHSDVVQAAGMIPMDVVKLPVDFLTISSHKIGGPKGTGACFIRRGTKIAPILTGGGQERELRSGTENVAAIVGFGKACEIAKCHIRKGVSHVSALRNQLEEGLLSSFPMMSTNGSREDRAPHILNVTVPGLDAERLVMALDAGGICASAGSACSSGSLEPSHVLLAMGASPKDARSAIRFCLGTRTDEGEIAAAVQCIKKVLHELRNG